MSTRGASPPKTRVTWLDGVKYLPLIWGALRRRPARTLLTALSVITAFFLFGTLQGVNIGIDNVMKVVNVAHLRVMSRISMADVMPVSHVARIAALPEVNGVSGLTFMVGSYQRPSNMQSVIGVDIEQMLRIYPEIKVPPDQLAAVLRTRSGVIVGKALAEKQGWKIGDRLPINGLNVQRKDGTPWVFDIVALYDLDQHDWATQIIGHYEYFNQARSTGKDTAMQILVGIKDPSHSAKVAQQIDDLFANSPDQTVTQNEKDFIQGLLRQIGDISFLVNSIVGAVLFTLLFLTANTMAQSVRERVPELAVLKTVGFTDAGVQWLVLSEAMILSLIAAAIGLGLASVALPAVSSMPQLGVGAMHVPHNVLGLGLAVAALLALASGLPPAQRARRLQVATALSGR
jgi:putative ABC transport system permease protein